MHQLPSSRKLLSTLCAPLWAHVRMRTTLKVCVANLAFLSTICSTWVSSQSQPQTNHSMTGIKTLNLRNRCLFLRLKGSPYACDDSSRLPLAFPLMALISVTQWVVVSKWISLRWWSKLHSCYWTQSHWRLASVTVLWRPATAMYFVSSLSQSISLLPSVKSSQKLVAFPALGKQFWARPSWSMELAVFTIVTSS